MLRTLISLFPTTKQDMIAASIVFVVYFLSVKLGLFIFAAYDTAPALIWPPVGIALVAVIFCGYRMWFAVFLAHYVALTTEIPDTHVVAFFVSSGYALQAIIARYLMEEFGFTRRISTLRDTLILVAIAFFITTIEPAVITTAQHALGNLSGSPYAYFARIWSAGVFSALVIVPLALAWYPIPRRLFPVRRPVRIELSAAFLLLIAVNYIVFWTEYTQYFGVSVIFFLPLVLIWFALRFRPRFLALAVFATALQSIAGTLLANPSDNPISEQLLAVEVYVGMVAAIFYVFAAVVEERRATFRRLEHAFKSTVDSNLAKNHFIAILAHELRNPLATIVSTLELLKLKVQEHETRAIVENTEDHVKMIQRLLDDLLDTVRLAQGRFNLKKESVRLNNIIEQSVASVQDFVQAHRHTLSVTTPKDSDIVLYADPVRLRQIIVNLLTNACKYTPDGGTIELAATVEDDSVIFRITDTGVGIEKEVLPHLFEAYRQTRQDVERGTGLGIGLYITKELVEKHGGRIDATSEGPGHGSTFWVVLPIKNRNNVQQTAGNRVVPDEPRTALRRILIVDDNTAAANVLKKLLEHHGYSVAVSYTGTEAITAVPAFKPDAVLLDIGLPDLDGHAVAKKLRHDGFTGMLIALTGYGQESDRIESKAAGFDHHLVKPAGAEDIIALMS